MGSGNTDGAEPTDVADSMPGAGAKKTGNSQATGESETKPQSKMEQYLTASSTKGAELKQEDASSAQGTDISMKTMGGIFAVAGVIGIVAFFRKRKHGDFTAIESEISI